MIDIYIPNKQSNRTRYVKVLLAISALYVGFDLATYAAASPPIKLAKLETIKQPYADRIRADEALSRLFPRGSDKTETLSKLKAAGFDGLTHPKLTNSQEESYFGRTTFSAGLLGMACFIWYELQIVVVFHENKLTELRAYVFKTSL